MYFFRTFSHLITLILLVHTTLCINTHGWYDLDGWNHVTDHQVPENSQLGNQEAILIEDTFTKCAASQLWKMYWNAMENVIEMCNMNRDTKLPEQPPKSPQIPSRIDLRRDNYMNLRQKKGGFLCPNYLDTILKQMIRHIHETQSDFTKLAEYPSLEPFKINRPTVPAAEKESERPRYPTSMPLFSAIQEEFGLDLLDWRNVSDMKFQTLRSVSKTPNQHNQSKKGKDSFYAVRGK